MSGEREPILVGAHYDRIGRGAFIFKGALDERTAAGVHIVAPAELNDELNPAQLIARTVKK